MAATAHTDHVAELDLHPNEASGLTRSCDPRLLEHFGWDIGFFTVLDEVDVEDCVALLGHDRDAPMADGWQVHRLGGKRVGSTGDADDAEAVAVWDGFVYVFGSHHGGKSGPIRRREQWIARFEESAVVDDDEAGVGGVTMTVLDTAFRWHRLLNDALRDCGVAMTPMSDGMRKAFIDPTVDELRGTAEEGRVRRDDWTVNIEGADFTPAGSLLVGLRFPVSAEGLPVVVQLADWQRVFEEPDHVPTVEAVWEIEAVGRNGSMAGVRDVCTVGDAVHVVTGDLDSAGKGSVIREDYPDGNNTVSTHFVASLTGVGGGRVSAQAHREFPDHPRIEGIATDGGEKFFYVSDEEDAIALRSTPLFTGG